MPIILVCFEIEEIAGADKSEIIILTRFTKAKSAYIANDTLQMLRVFYNWLIEPKQHNDPRMRDAENPISDAMSVPKLGPKRLKVEDPKGGKWHKQEPPEELESLTDKQTNMLILTIERSLIADPKKRADRMHNRNVLSILFGLSLYQKF